MAIEKLQPCSAHDALVTISTYDNGAVSGYLIHPRLDAPISIRSLSQLVCLLDQVKKLESVPSKPTNEDTISLASLPRIASFTISVLFQQNCTIQGKLVWNEKQMEATFRSALELIYLLDSVLAESREKTEARYA